MQQQPQATKRKRTNNFLTDQPARKIETSVQGSWKFWADLSQAPNP